MWLAQSVLTGNEAGYWFISEGGRIWLLEGDIPFGSAADFKLAGLTGQVIGQWQEKHVWLVNHSMPKAMHSVKKLLGRDECLFQLAGRATQLSLFYQSHQFCGRCASAMQVSKSEWCCICSHCRQRYYPQISPAVIVAIRDKNKLLLANHARHTANNVYTVLAGFVEVGETVETALEREIFEESKLKVKHIRYVSSQPWPFPNSLMLAYLADYQEGVLNIDKKELVDANWYHYTRLPKLPAYGTIARRLIEDTIALCRRYDEEGDE